MPPRPPDFLPTSLAEAGARGWSELDVVLVSGDAYVDHPAFAAALLGRVLEAAGFRVGLLSQPDWRSAEPFRALGRPRLFFGVTAGNVDSMLANYTPRRLPRRDDAYSPRGEAGRRPDRATAVYAQRCREAFRGVPVIIGGVEASLRRLAHWDHWSRTVRPSILLSSKADLLVYGMGERLIVEIARRLGSGAGPGALRELPSTCALLGRSEVVPGELRQLPSFEDCRARPELIGEVTAAVHRQGRGAEAETLAQIHGDQLVICRPPAAPSTPEELDRIFALPFRRAEHPALGGPVPALETVRWSVVTHRGCFGGCNFCGLAVHQGREVVSRTRDSVLGELRRLASSPDFPGVITDLGGPSANMYGLGCARPDGGERCRRRSCLHPKRCKSLSASPGPWLELLRAARQVPGVKLVRVASGVRMDLLLDHPEALDELVRHHAGGQLKVAPEHDGAATLAAMGKYSPGTLRRFKAAFDEACRRAGQERFLVAYLMAGHPGTTLEEMAALAAELASLGLRPRQVQDFTPTPLTISTAQHVSGRDPLTDEELRPVRGDRARADQRALLQWFLPEHAERARKLFRDLGLPFPGSTPLARGSRRSRKER